jgi:hypothetical protein
MDLAWSGVLRYDSIGAVCRNTVPSPQMNTGVFPNNRLCTPAAAGSNDPEPLSSYGNSGDNGYPIGSNPGDGSQTTGSIFWDAEDLCRTGRSVANPCVYKVGSERPTVAALAWSMTSGSATSLRVEFSRDDMTPTGSTFSLFLSWSLFNQAGDVSTAASTLQISVTIIRNATSQQQTGWAASWLQGTRILTITSGSDVFPGEPVRVVLSQLTMTSSATYPASVVASVNGGKSRTTVIVRNGALLSTYTTLPGDPVGSYSRSSSSFIIAAGDVVSARVYAYNGRFKSAAATSLVQARAISRPQAPGYFTAQSQAAVKVMLGYTLENKGEPTGINVKITPPVDLPNGTSVVISLLGFDGPNYASLCPTCALAVLGQDGAAHGVFTAANWVKNTSSLILTVGEGATAVERTEYEVNIPVGAGIRYPLDPSAMTRDSSGVHVTSGFITIYQLDWVTPFPTLSQPRKGFMVQMTTDRNWFSDIQTVVFEDRLSGGVGAFVNISVLGASLTSTGTTLTLQDASTLPITTYAKFLGKDIKIDDELMRVEEVLSTTQIRVLRGRRGTMPVVHAEASTVYSTSIGATDPLKGTFPGLDQRIGTAGTTPTVADDGCRLGLQNFQRGCNVASPPVQYLTGLRSFQTALISSGLPLARSFTNCGTSGDTCITSSCTCTTPTMESFTDFGTPMAAAETYIRNTADPLQWSNIPVTRLLLAMSDSVNNVVLADSSSVLESYMRIDNELMYVRGGARSGVDSISLYQAFGTAASGSCSCSMTGAASGGGTCSCLPSSQVTNCASGGTLRTIGGVGLGFRATFTVGGGAITSITIDDPGYGYLAIPEIIIATGGDSCVFGKDLRFLPRLSTKVVQVDRGAFGTSAVAHSSGTYVSLVTWPLRDNPGSPGTQYYFRIAAYNDAGVSDYLYFRHRITDMSPNVFATTGGTPVEITMEGGGYFPGNTSVYVGHTKPDGTIDFNR